MNDPVEQLERLGKLKQQGALTAEQYDQAVQQILTPAAAAPKPAPPLVDINTSIELLEGSRIGAKGRKFQLIKKIGSGGMGQVWQARDLAEEAALTDEGKTPKPVYKALKVVNSHLMHSPGAIKKLQKEAINASKLSHPNIINVNGWHQGEEGWLFVEMEYLQGEDLESYLGDYDDGLSWQQSQPILQAVAEGLSYAHQQGIIHRDLKPGNIYRSQDQQIKILDFGLAYRLRKSSMSNNAAQNTDTSGVAEYMPPEAFMAAKPDSRHDVYAFACLVYELLTGEPPYSKEKAVNRKEDEWPPKPEKLTDKAWAELKQGLAYQQKKRSSSIEPFFNALKRAQNQPNTKPVIKPQESVEDAVVKESVTVKASSPKKKSNFLYQTFDFCRKELFKLKAGWGVISGVFVLGGSWVIRGVGGFEGVGGLMVSVVLVGLCISFLLIAYEEFQEDERFILPISLWMFGGMAAVDEFNGFNKFGKLGKYGLTEGLVEIEQLMSLGALGVLVISGGLWALNRVPNKLK